MNCEQCKPLLFELIDQKISSEDRASVNEHLDDCGECSSLLSEMWDMQAMATRWQDKPVPHWNRRAAYFEGVSWFPMLQVASGFASVIVMVLVLAQVQVSTNDGLTVHFGKALVDEAYVDARLENRLNEFEQNQQAMLATNIDRLTDQQAASNQLVLRTLLETNRQERRDEMTQLVTLLDEAQSQRTERTEASLRYLIASQLEDRRNIQQLGQAIQLVANEGGTL